MIRRVSLAATSTLALFACSQEPAPQPKADPASAPHAESPEAPEEPVRTTPAPESEPVLTSTGFGPLMIGMVRADVVSAMGGPESPVSAPGTEPSACEIFHPVDAPEGVFVLLEEGMLASVYLAGQSEVATAEGVKVGDPAEKVKSVYGNNVVASPSKYLEPPAGELTVWQNGDTSGAWVDDVAARGIRFSIGTGETITEIKAGGPAIQLVEGCS